MPKNSVEPEYFVVLSENDNTYNTVPASDVLCSEFGDLQVGDSVRFYWNKVMHTGPIQHMGDDFTVCNKLAEKLSAQMKYALKRSGSSFHAEKPRKSKLRGIEKLSKSSRAKSPSTPPKKRKSKANEQKETKRKREIEEAVQILSEQNNQSCNDDSLNSTLDNSQSSEESTSSVSTDEDSPGSKRHKANSDVQRQLEEKVKELSAKLAAAVSSPQPSHGSSSDITQTPSSRGSTGLHSQVSTNTPTQPKAKPHTTAFKSYNLFVAKGGKPFMGKMLLFDSPHEDATELLGHDNKRLGVYCETSAYDAADNSGNATTAARRLLAGVFTEEAVRSCSITGLPPRGKGREAYSNASTIRPHLCPRAVRAIIDQALEWQRVKYLRPKKEVGSIRSAMGIKLCELREKAEKYQQFI